MCGLACLLNLLKKNVNYIFKKYKKKIRCGMIANEIFPPQTRGHSTDVNNDENPYRIASYTKLDMTNVNNSKEKFPFIIMCRF